MTALTDLSHSLWRQRRLLELLLFKLEVQQLLLAAGRTRWIAPATKEVEHVLDEIRAGELDRAIHVVTVAGELGMADREPSLGALVAAAPAPWNEILSEHQQAFLAMTRDVEELSRTNRDLLQRGMQAARELLAGLSGTGPIDGYSAAGEGQRRQRSSLLDRVV